MSHRWWFFELRWLGRVEELAELAHDLLDFGLVERRVRPAEDSYCDLFEHPPVHIYRGADANSQRDCVAGPCVNRLDTTGSFNIERSDERATFQSHDASTDDSGAGGVQRSYSQIVRTWPGELELFDPDSDRLRLCRSDEDREHLFSCRCFAQQYDCRSGCGIEIETEHFDGLHLVHSVLQMCRGETSVNSTSTTFVSRAVLGRWFPQPQRRNTRAVVADAVIDWSSAQPPATSIHNVQAIRRPCVTP